MFAYVISESWHFRASWLFRELGGAKILRKSSSLCLGCNNVTNDRRLTDGSRYKFKIYAVRVAQKSKPPTEGRIKTSADLGVVVKMQAPSKHKTC